MATGSGMTSQIGWVDESVYGTPVTVTKFTPFLSESISNTYGRVVADDIIAGAQTMRADQTRTGNNDFAGSFSQYLTARHSHNWFKYVLGSISTANTYDHTLTPASTAADSFTLQVGRTDTAGTVVPFTYSGCKVASLSLSGSNDGEGSFIDLTTDIVAQDMTTATGLASASYLASNPRYTMSDLVVSINGADTCVTAFDLTIANSFELYRCGGSRIIEEPVRNGPVTLTGSVTAKWTGTTNHNLVANATSADIIFTFTNGSNTVTITSTARYDLADEFVAGKGVVFQTIGFADAGTSDSAGISVVVHNADAT